MPIGICLRRTNSHDAFMAVKVTAFSAEPFPISEDPRKIGANSFIIRSLRSFAMSFPTFIQAAVRNSHFLFMCLNGMQSRNLDLGLRHLELRRQFFQGHWQIMHALYPIFTIIGYFFQPF